MGKASIEKANERITEILANRESEEMDLKGLIEVDKEAIATADQAMEEATNAGNIEAFRKAKAEKQNAADSLEMHERRLATLEKKELIGKTEYEKLCADIFAEVAALEDTTKQKLAKLADEANEAGNALADAINRANSTLRKLQRDVYRCADMPKNGKGETINAAGKEIKNWETYDWAKAGVNHAAYKNYTGNTAK